MARLDDLKDARSVMWDSIQTAAADKRAPLMQQWRALEATIAELESHGVKTGDPIDEIAARRAARGGSSARVGRAGGGSV